MGKFNGSTPKPHRAWSNDEKFLSRLVERAGSMTREEQSRCPGKTTRKYVDKNGIKRHVGLKDALKDSQHPGGEQTPLFGCWDSLHWVTICAPILVRDPTLENR